MASISSPTTILLLLLLLFLSVSISNSSITKSQSSNLLSRRSLRSIGEEEDEPVSKPPPKKKTISEIKNQTKLLKPKKTNSTTTITDTKIKPPKALNSSTFKTKLTKALNSSTIKTKLTKALNSTTIKTTLTKTLNSTTTKSSNSTKPMKPIKFKSNSTILYKSSKKASDLPTFKNKTTSIPKPEQPTNPKPKPNQKEENKSKKPKSKFDPSRPWLEQEDGESSSDLVSEFRDLPSRLLPDLAKISTTSHAYITKANKEIARNFKPYVGNKYAPMIASATSCMLLLLPLLLLTLVFHKLRNYLSLQKALIFIQAYLAIYFATLAITALVTGLEPLRFFYATSPASYACTQALQTLGYVLYLVVQLVNMVVVFSGSDGEVGRGVGLGLAQMVVGLAVGLHYYVAVFHRAVAGEPPRANWKVHGVYALCFLVVCALARAERRKKAYLLDGAGDGKKS